MSNLQIKGVDEGLYQDLKQLAAEENRSVSQQVLFLIRRSLARKRQVRQAESGAEVLLSLAGSWEDAGQADEIIAVLRDARRSSKRLSKG